jgi:hypothetical protein
MAGIGVGVRDWMPSEGGPGDVGTKGLKKREGGGMVRGFLVELLVPRERHPPVVAQGGRGEAPVGLEAWGHPHRER